LELNKDNVLARMLEHKEAIISHLQLTVSWVSLFLGFHTLGLYIHNDTVIAFGQPEKQILFEPLFAEYIQAASGKAVYEFNTLLSSSTSPATVAGNQIWLPGWLEAINNNKNDLFLKIKSKSLCARKQGSVE
jgi:photosystem I P700 chlorophyll a apoprotein A2